jgi:hypothetical protein
MRDGDGKVVALPLERRVVRAGVVGIGIAALVVIVCSFLPGYHVIEHDRRHCDTSFDLWGHSSRDDGPCIAKVTDLGNEPAGSPTIVVLALLAMLPAVWVWRGGLAWRAVAWGGMLWSAAVALLFVAIASYERSSSGCGDGISHTRETLWPAIVLGWSAIVIFFGPMVVALVGGITRLRERRRIERERIPPAIVV